ncbi:hypothetical protein OG413_05805 [Streptomyces sp. NBC_01433]|uniref:hypothetical protein n=1 Tax=Streptomyces sp. NBC_01433 TaxID=2903864 RepID=UPI002254CF35|nr:hypothetical protein [Streptomyces sp. NBC_01433]MCX4674844.1 hypothetical protein [Streptomyces sp. NBC_01433]
MSRAHRLLAGLLTAGALFTVTAGCAQSVDPIERLGRKAAQKVGPRSPSPKATVLKGSHGACGRRPLSLRLPARREGGELALRLTEC